ncbi:MAG: 4'-phosphopantetheinyl transferase superfamily protein [Desulfobacteraceae bacterium]|nr:MAG: 4'-phosphopantetheinyl transferase superfamily protein [Desulfobacteraceae bacterium]
MNPVKLNQDEIHLWFAFPEEAKDPNLLSTYEKLLCEEELERKGRFYFEKHRHQYLVARALVRTTLSRYTGIDPRMLRFFRNRYGKPELAAGEIDSSIRFNLSHTDGLAMLGVVLDRDIGVDVEDMGRLEVSSGLAERFFSPNEVKDLASIPEDLRRSRFFDYWTLKESYIKACGMGLSIPLDQFGFVIPEGSPPRISFSPQRTDDPLHWQFRLFHPTDRHRAAVCVRSHRIKYRFSIKRTTPMVDEKDFLSEPSSLHSDR